MPRKPRPDEPAEPAELTDLILRIFRANGRLLLAGDQLVAPLGLTSARWQLLGSIAASDRPQPVVGLARDMGISRQAVQRIVNDLEREGVVSFQPNPRHKRAQLVTFTGQGQALYERALALQRPWVTGLADGLSNIQVKSACNTLEALVAGIDREELRHGDERTSASE